MLQQRAANRIVDDQRGEPKGSPLGGERPCLERFEEAGFDIDDVVVEPQVERPRVIAEAEEVADYPKAAVSAGKLLDLAAWIGRGQFVQIASIAFIAAIVPQLPLDDFLAAEDVMAEKAQVALPASRRDDDQLHSNVPRGCCGFARP